ncbi:MAG: hypothetical protein JRF28_04515 [Deltaproteobacteria bacterium]|nr:hypothetical protein [Deltaproteobacteria bacterium]
MKHTKVLCFLSLLIFTFSCGGSPTEGEEHVAISDDLKEVSSTEDLESSSPFRKTNNYAPGQVIVKFKPDTQQQDIETIQTELHLKILRTISRPNVYLMKIENGTPVEEIVEQLQEFEAVKYVEPNYVRSVQ